MFLQVFFDAFFSNSLIMYFASNFPGKDLQFFHSFQQKLSNITDPIKG